MSLQAPGTRTALVVRFDVTDLTPAQIDALAFAATVQGEENDPEREDEAYRSVPVMGATLEHLPAHTATGMLVTVAVPRLPGHGEPDACDLATLLGDVREALENGTERVASRAGQPATVSVTVVNPMDEGLTVSDVATFGAR